MFHGGGGGDSLIVNEESVEGETLLWVDMRQYGDRDGPQYLHSPPVLK